MRDTESLEGRESERHTERSALVSSLTHTHSLFSRTRSVPLSPASLSLFDKRCTDGAGPCFFTVSHSSMVFSQRVDSYGRLCRREEDLKESIRRVM